MRSHRGPHVKNERRQNVRTMLYRKKLFLAMGVGLALALVLTSSAFGQPRYQGRSYPETYVVTVGLEDAAHGVEVNAFFPDNLTIAAGDTVRWVQNTNEIHTVTFLSGNETPELIVPAPAPGPSPLVFNPVAANPSVPPGASYNGTGYVNSGLMGRETGQAGEFTLTFTMPGTYQYLCLVHGMVMSGNVTVRASGAPVPSPYQAMFRGTRQMVRALARVPDALADAAVFAQSASANVSGTHHIYIGYTAGQIELMQFFPTNAVVAPGDNITWVMSPRNDAPHTVTFLNGNGAPGLVVPVPQKNGPPLLYLDPRTLNQHPASPVTLSDNGSIFNSGILNPVPGTTYSVTVADNASGTMPYVCLLHDESGMRGSLIILR